MKLYVANLAPRVTEEHLQQLFGQFGQILTLEIKWFHKAGHTAGTAVLEMNSPEALLAARSLNGKALRNRRLYIAPMAGVDQAAQPPLRP